MRAFTAWIVVLCVGAMLGCGDDSPPSEIDAGDHDDASTEGPDAGPCTSDEACSDGEFCNGEETCDPDSEDADSRGCLDAAQDACSADQSCDEEAERCVDDCGGTEDEDGDGFSSIACDGTDCDDSDRNRFPGNIEVCDATGHDEDCDPETFGARDLDGDGELDGRCCNEAEDGGQNCGEDCDDTTLARRTGQLEICDSIDNDCDDEVDEEMNEVPWYGDDDGDGFGGDTTSGDPSCTPIVGASLADSDCDDEDASEHPAQLEVCDFLDNNCNRQIDERGLCPTRPGGPLPSCGDEGQRSACLCVNDVLGERECQADETFSACDCDGPAATIGEDAAVIGGPQDGVRLALPAGALSESTAITVEAATDYPADEALVEGTAYDYGPDGTVFDEPVILTIYYDPSKLPAGWDEESLRIHKLVVGEWVEVAGGSVDTHAKTVSAPLMGFSSYAVLATERLESVDPECTANETECVDTMQVRTCGEDGEWEAATTCQFVCVGDECGGVCDPDDTRCAAVGEVVQTCNAAGEWVDTMTCEQNYACDAGNCVSTCPTGFANCETSNLDCETDIRTIDNCGDCGITCDDTHATVICEQPALMCEVDTANGGCAPGYADCDDSGETGCEAPTATDALNCGRCDRQCGDTATCTAGGCGITTLLNPSVLSNFYYAILTPNDRIFVLTVYSGFFEVRYGYKNVNLPQIEGTQVRTVAIAQGDDVLPRGLTQDADYVYWGYRGSLTVPADPGVVQRFRIDGTGLVTNAFTTSNGVSFDGLTHQAGSLYWINNVPGAGSAEIRSRAVTGAGSDAILVSNRGTIRGLLVTPTKLIWSENTTGAEYHLYMAPIGGGSGGEIVHIAQVTAATIFNVDATHVYWTDNGPSNAVDDKISRYAFDAASPSVEPLLTGVVDTVGAVLDDDYVYFTATNNGYVGVVHRIPKTGGVLPEKLSISGGGLNVRSLWGVDDQYIYLTPLDLGPYGYGGYDVVSRLAK